jgi:hypothetical protein
MKKLIFISLILLSVTSIKAQNVQILNGFSGINGSYVNFATFELYKDLKGGPLYYFTDFKMSNKGYFEAYTEISKYWYFTQDKFSVTTQYNAGLNKDYQIQPVYLLGLSKGFLIKGNFNLQFDAMYRYQKDLCADSITKEQHNGYQITTIFSRDWKKFQLSGYLDFWNTKYFIFEPQVWYKATKNIFIGAEYRASNYSLLENYRNYIMFGLKWDMSNAN